MRTAFVSHHVIRASIAVAMLVFVSTGSAAVTTSFDGATLDPAINLDIPDASLGEIVLDTVEGELDFNAFANTDMWGQRNNAPIAWTAQPAVEDGHLWYIETEVRLEDVGVGQQVAGITFYGGPDGERPDFTFSLDNWNAAGRVIKLQGLGDNNPNIFMPWEPASAMLRVEVLEAGDTDTYNFFYKETAEESWTQLVEGAKNFASDFPNSQPGLFYKTNAEKPGAAFTFLDVASLGAPTVLTWDGSESAWGGITAGVSHWSGGMADRIPDRQSAVIVNAGVSTVEAAATAKTLALNGGEVVISGDQSLEIIDTADLAAGTTLSVGANATLQVGGPLTAAAESVLTMEAGGKLVAAEPGQLGAINSRGSLTIVAGADLTAAAYDDGAAADTIFTKQGPGTLALTPNSVTATNTTVFQVSEGTLSVAGVAPVGDAESVVLDGGTLSVSNPVGSNVSATLVTDGLIQDLDASVGVTADAEGVTAWVNQIAGSGDDMAQIDPERKPTLVTGGLNGFDTISLDGEGDRLEGDDAEAFTDTMTGSGLTWLAVAKPTEQDGQSKNVIAGTLVPAGPWTGFTAGVHADTTPYSMIRPSGDVWANAQTPTNDGEFHILAGRLAAGTGEQLSEVFVDNPLAQGSSVPTISEATTAGPLAIGAEHVVGAEDFAGEIARILIYDRPLTDEELTSTGLALQELYALDTAFEAAISLERVEMTGATLTVAADSTLDVTAGGSFGTLSLVEGTLTITGTEDVDFVATTIPAEAADVVGIDPRIPTELGQINFEKAGTLSKRGPEELVLTGANVGSGFLDATIDVSQGRLVGLHGPNPFGEASLQLSGGELVLSSTTGDAAFDNSVSVAQGAATLSAGTAGGGMAGPATVTLGGADKEFQLAEGAMLTLQSTDDYTLEIATPIVGTAASGGLVVTEGSVLLSGGADVGMAKITGGTLAVGADTTVTKLQVSGEGAVVDTGESLITVGQAMTLGDVEFTMDQDNTFQIAGNDLLNSEVSRELTLGGGQLSIGSPQAGALAHWSFDFGIDPDLGSMAMTETGVNMIEPADAKFGAGALDTPGDGFLATDAFEMGGSFTAAAWIKPRNVSANWVGILGKNEGPNGTKTFWLGQHGTDGEIRFGNYFDGAGESALDSHMDVPEADLENETWYHVVGVWDQDAGMQQLYIDGELVGEQEQIGMEQMVTDVPMNIGRSSCCNFDGLIDEVWLFESALSAEQVQTLMTANADPGSVAFGELVMPNTNVLVTADSTLELNSRDDAWLGDLQLKNGASLEIDGADAIFRDVTTEGDSAINSPLLVRGTLSPGNGVAAVQIDGYLELGAEEEGVVPTYLAEVDGSGADLVAVSEAVFLEGALDLRGIGRLSQVGNTQATIMSLNSDEEIIEGEFDTPPADAGPDSHIGFGQFFRGIEYAEVLDGNSDLIGSEINIDVFQAAYGDLNGDRQVNILDIFKIKSSPKGFGSGATDAEWTDGDMVGANPMLPADGMVTLMDIFAIKQAGHFGAGAYAAGVETLVNEDGTAQLIYDAATGELTLQNEDGVEAILLESAAGLFVGEADETLANFVELTPEVFGAVSFDGALPMGSMGMVLPAGLDEATLTGDLTILGSAELVYQAVPEPGTLVLVALALAGMALYRRRQNA